MERKIKEGGNRCYVKTARCMNLLNFYLPYLETMIRVDFLFLTATFLNKKSLPKQKTIQNFTIDAQGFRKTKNENPPTWEMGVTS